MKKYAALMMILISTYSFAAEKNSVQLGQVDSSNSQNDCNAPEIAGCGPCYKLCLQQHGGEGMKDFSSPSDNKKQKGKSSATVQ